MIVREIDLRPGDIYVLSEHHPTTNEAIELQLVLANQPTNSLDDVRRVLTVLTAVGMVTWTISSFSMVHLVARP